MISPVDVKGFIEVVDELEHVQDKVYDRPTVLVSGRVKGEEEIPDGAVAVLTPDMPDVLSHVSVRARNGKVRGSAYLFLIRKQLLLHLLNQQLVRSADLLCDLLRPECAC